ncbi:hypothetical protein ASPCAL05310 [Aspergillus calidoustus]|uniref:DUF6891 domain-containing protein n=1 Tax=Aspergillus calidoustus TaxID=454130 RepID=A0A0U5FXU9_ASPCI|nr:hypothetical protein ASPCAL05310 [Aspergillus calidoustus]
MDMSRRHQDRSESDADIQRSIAWRVRSGFYTSDEIVEIVAQPLPHNQAQTSGQPHITISQARRAIRPLLALEWARQVERQQSWPRDQPTICDKIDKAFSSLQRNHGILARMNFTCCATCGIGEIAEDRDEDTRGYVFFHEQDMEGVAMDGRELSLVFGSFSRSEKKNRAVGEVIVRSLRRVGVKVEWEGEASKRIRVVCGEWRRRVPEDEEVEDVGDGDFDSECLSSGESESEMESDGVDDLEVKELELEASME